MKATRLCRFALAAALAIAPAGAAVAGPQSTRIPVSIGYGSPAAPSGPASPLAVLYDQTDSGSGAGIVSQDFETALRRLRRGRRRRLRRAVGLELVDRVGHDPGCVLQRARPRGRGEPQLLQGQRGGSRSLRVRLSAAGSGGLGRNVHVHAGESLRPGPRHVLDRRAGPHGLVLRRMGLEHPNRPEQRGRRLAQPRQRLRVGLHRVRADASVHRRHRRQQRRPRLPVLALGHASLRRGA